MLKQARRWVLSAGLMALFVLLFSALWLYTPDRPRALLETRYAAPPSTFMVIDGVRLHVRDSGPKNAPALLLLHGFASSLHTWDDWAARLEGRYRVVRLDLPGAALTGADPSGDYSDARSLQILCHLLDRLGIARATWVGHSMGGRLAWEAAARDPKRVERLVLIAPDGFASPGFAYGEPAHVPPFLQLMRWVLPQALLRANLAAAYGDPGALTAARVQTYYDMLLAPGVRAAILIRLSQTVLTDPRAELARIQAPTLLLWGQNDAMIPIANARDYMQAIPHSQLVAVPGAGHVLQEEAPAACLNALLPFLTQPLAAP